MCLQFVSNRSSLVDRRLEKLLVLHSLLTACCLLRGASLCTYAELTPFLATARRSTFSRAGWSGPFTTNRAT